MKKPLALALALVLLAGLLAACDGGTPPAAATPTPAPKEEKLSVTTEELSLESGGKKIYGVMYRPEGDKDRYPAVILSHGFNSSSVLNEGYAQSFAEKGYAAYIFDFCGGSPSSKSEGAVTEMSVLTERQNLIDVMDQIKALDYVDGEQIFLFGLSQGGFVSALAAAQRPDDVKGLILFYPAFSLQEGCWERHGSVENVPETEEVMGVTIGAVYSIDAMSLDLYEIIGDYKGDVLICHGDKDALVDLSYSEKAVEAYDSAELKVIKYGEHGFQGKLAREAAAYSVEFLQAHTD